MFDYSQIAEAIEDRAEGEELFFNKENGALVRFFEGVDIAPNLDKGSYIPVPDNLIVKSMIMKEYAAGLCDKGLSRKLLLVLEDEGEKRFLDILRVYSLFVDYSRFLHSRMTDAVRQWASHIEK